MYKLSLSKLVEERGQAAVASMFGVSPAAIHKALKRKRNIIVTINEDGGFYAEETRQFPGHKIKRSDQVSNADLP